MSSTGLEAVYIANRAKLVRFLMARGAGDAAEDLVNDLWIKLNASPVGPIGKPLSYLFRAADALMIDRYRSRQRTERRDREWLDSVGDDDSTTDVPSSERVVVARQELDRVAAALASLGPRRETVFRRARLDRTPQPQIAAELGVSLSTVENDLRIACRTLASLQEHLR
jgi:RNA polymerase sigma-70 factor (ECF subfamily)